MPLNTSIRRDGKALEVRWGGFHVVAMTLAATWEHEQGPFKDNSDPREQEIVITNNKTGETHILDYPEEAYPITTKDVWDLMGYHIVGTTRLNSEEVTLTRPHRFLDTTDGEVFDLLPGDVLSVWRD